MTGRVIKGIGGFYFVHDGERVIMGKARGGLKRNKELIYVGDIVDFDIDENDGDNDCIINKVIERRNFLSRPPVSNLDMLIIVFSIREPAVNYPVIDKLTAGCIRKAISPVICITKTDLASREELEDAASVYRDIFPVVMVNGRTGEGLEDLEDMIKGHSAALAGPSGVGKSTLTNLLTGEHSSDVLTGSISEKTGRGRHTTRHVEIFNLPGDTYLYDTPGFTSLDMPEMELSEVRELFPEFARISHKCRYSDCAHINEPDCAVKEAVNNGSISNVRYGSYLMMMEEVRKCLR